MTRILFLLAIFLFSYNFGIGQCQPNTLYGVNGGSNDDVNSFLFILNIQTGNFQIIGDIGYSGVRESPSIR